MNLLQRFAAESSGPSVHVAPTELFQIGGWPITNSILYGWIIGVLVCVFLVWVARKAIVKPKGGIVQIIEFGTEFITNLVVNAFDNKEKGRKYVPFFVTLFFFLLLNNWLGLLPLIGEAFTPQTVSVPAW